MTPKYLFAGFLALTLFLSAEANAQTKHFVIKGYVLDSVSRKPVVDAEIYLYNQANHEYHIHSDKNGHYSFDSLNYGLYVLNVVAEGYHIFYNKIVIERDQQNDALLCPLGEHLHELRVVGRSSVDEVSTSPSVQFEKLMLDQNRGQTLGDMLKNAPGVYLLSTGAGIAKPVIRGMSGQRILLMNAGVRQEGQQWGSDHAPAIDPFAAHSVELIKGASSVLYGSDAIGGVIRILPRTAREKAGISGEFSLNGFSNNLQAASSLLLEGRLKKQPFTWRVQGSLRKAGDSRAPDYVISNTGFNERNYSAELGYQGKNLKSSLLYTHIGSNTGIFRGAHLGNLSDFRAALQQDRPYYIKPFTWKITNPRQEVTHDMMVLNSSYSFKAGILSGSISAQLNNRKEFDVVNPIFSKNLLKPNYDLDLKTGIAGLNFEHRKIGHWKGTLGYAHTSQTNSATGISFIIPNFLVRNHGVYLLEKYSKGRWFAEFGSRAEYRKLVILQYVQTVLTREERHFKNFALVAGGGYYFSDKFKSTLNLARAFRTPAINELYSNGLHGGTATYETGNSALKSEYSWAADISSAYSSKHLKLEGSIFFNYIQNYIYQQPDTHPTLTIRGAFPTLRFMQADAFIRGLELSGEYDFAYRWKLSGAFSGLLGDNLSKEKPLIYMPPARLNLAVLRELKTKGIFSNFVVKLSATWVARQNRFTADEDYLPPPPAYLLLDFDIAGNVRMLKRNAMLSLSFRNLLNASYRDYLDRFRYFTDQPGFNNILRLTIPFEINTQKNEKH